MRVHEDFSSIQDKDKNPVIVDRLSEGDGAVGGQAVAAKTTRKSRRRKPRSATGDLKNRIMTNSSSGEGRRELSKFGNHIHQNHPAQSNSTPHLQSHGIGATTSGNHVTLRPRSLYTAHSYHPTTDVANFQRFNEFSKYLETPPTEQWTPMSGGVGGLNVNGSNSFIGPGAIWRQRNSKPSIIPSYYGAEDAYIYSENWRAHDDVDGASVGAIATPHGTISLRLHNRIRVDMTIDRAVRVINFKNNIVLSLSGSGSAAALLHPNGRIYQYGSRVEILAHDVHGNSKYAKMWYKGVSFTSEQCALVYLVDAAGTRTTTDSFSDMSQDFSLSVFYSESRHGPACLQEATTALGAAQYWSTDEGVENWIINNVRVSQTQDGLVRIARNSNKYQLRTSPSNGTASLTTPFLHCTASLGQTSHLFVRRGERRMHYDGTSFIVRNAGHSAGFDDNNQLKVY
ncbi:hypothetical protein PV327_009367 [Microctonus hyperodae]|uniref:Uncharacterized protein n=1 Tax=Microctonus hyperodae TaxID=165561 RepID=A0AA39KVZ7_MICHY|nr:hypothetical protein PV327_009367 [Microctonus hyperodae]